MLQDADAIQVLGGVFGFLASLAVIIIVFLFPRRMRGYVSYGLLCGISMALMSVNAIGKSSLDPQTVIISVSYPILALMAVNLMLGAYLAVRLPQLLSVMFAVQSSVGLLLLGALELPAPDWLEAFLISFGAMYGLACVLLLRPQKRAFFND